MFGGLASLLTGGLVKAVMAPFTEHMRQSGMSQRNIDVVRGDVEKSLYRELGTMSKAQASAIKAEVSSGWFLAANWRAIGGLCFICVFLFYSMWIPITVAYFHWPAPRIGDTLLGWNYDLLKMSLGGYVAHGLLDKVLTHKQRGRVR